MLDEDFKINTAQALARIEQKIDDVRATAVPRLILLEDKVAAITHGQISITTLLLLITTISGLAAAIGTNFPYVFARLMGIG
jgi:hypothetical protein